MDAVGPIFTEGLRIGFTTAAIGTLVGGLFALVVLPGRKRQAARAAATAPKVASDSASH
ncbi:hypothetical protein GCM10020295_26040 [Streptomyces cinereospinus]